MALSLNQTLNQWADLGIHTDACMTTMSCTNGGAVAMWIKITQGGHYAGVLTTRDKQTTSESSLRMWTFGTRSIQ